MSEHIGLSTYEIAYICGGPERVAMVALAALYDDGHITIARARRRVTVVEHDQDDPVRAVAVASVPSTGRTLGSVLADVAGSDEVIETGRSLRERGFLSGSGIVAFSRSARRARELRRRLETDLPDDAGPLRRVAVLGPAGIEDAATRRVFESPDPDLGVETVHLPGTSGKPDRSGGYNSPKHGDGYETGTGSSVDG